ncbi:protease FtsH subunit HflK [Rhizobiales bacterium GAS191]|jgi:membrane protease subunit HflK|nr:protease FtsH subunit HflK [Rhizobiales bacterium GAS113]SED91259.1 protease FtsH subunit HflK [Rhizobiales bacterium GAS191]SEE55635.1 protease FtsH subunit HflK [Rhizobiales bacterium GAS188]
MPWSNQSGGGGPWRPQGQGPWGQGPSGGNGGRQPPDFEDMIRRLQARLGGWFGGGSDGFSGKAILFLVLVGVLIWLATGLYTVQPKEVGLNLVFGRYVGTVGPGLNVNWPYPIGDHIKVQVLGTNTLEIGVSGPEIATRGARPNVEGLMLTGDDNIVDIDFSVQWQVDPARPQDYAFNIEDPEGTIKAVAESVMREVVGRRDIIDIITKDREAIAQEVKTQMQKILDSYKAGVQIQIVNLLKDAPPPEVTAAFQDVQAASIDRETLQNQAATYASKVVPEAKGEASKIIQAAEGYRTRTVAEAKGAASRFDQVYAEFKNAPDVTRERMYLETMERVFGGMDKVILDQGAGQGGSVLPYLPLGDLQRRQAQGAAK